MARKILDASQICTNHKVTSRHDKSIRHWLISRLVLHNFYIASLHTVADGSAYIERFGSDERQNPNKDRVTDNVNTLTCKTHAKLRYLWRGFIYDQLHVGDGRLLQPFSMEICRNFQAILQCKFHSYQATTNGWTEPRLTVTPTDSRHCCSHVEWLTWLSAVRNVRTF